MLTDSEYWVYNQITNAFEKTSYEPLSVFPTIVEPKRKIVFCRRCHRWEYITGFNKNMLMTQCGKTYMGPFVQENSRFNYGFVVNKKNDLYKIDVRSQDVVIRNHRLREVEFLLDFQKKVLYKNNVAVFESEDMANSICKELADEILDEMGQRYQSQYGIKPTIASEFKGFHLIVGYMLSPFNVNFYKISKHWGLNPYDKNFASLSSGDTPSAENEMFSSLGIKPTKTVRKMYQKKPQYVICYAATKDMGFTDVNILQKSYSPEYYDLLNYLMISFNGGEISYAHREGLKIFVQDMLQISTEKTVWNSIQRTVDYYKKNQINYFSVTNINDGIEAYRIYHEHLTDDEKKEIMREGFNQYTHDFLVRRIDNLGLDGQVFSDHLASEDEIFEIEDSFLELEYKAGDSKKKVINPKTGETEVVDCPDEERYCFYVAQSSNMLKVIGNAMHNCVGWCYTNSVRSRKSTIVYAKYMNRYRICIEVSPKFGIRQALGPCNSVLTGKDLEAYSEWVRKKHINTSNVFY